MKIAVTREFPSYFKPAYPEEFALFSHFETAAGVPQVLFAITTYKENRLPNVCFHSWACFRGDKTAFLQLWEFCISTHIRFQISAAHDALCCL